MLIAVSSFATLAAILVIIFFKEKPPTPTNSEPAKKRTEGHSARQSEFSDY